MVRPWLPREPLLSAGDATVSSSNAFPSLISAGKSCWPQALTWRAFPRCVSGCDCWAWWPQRRRARSSHTWRAGRWSASPRGSSAPTAGRRTGSSGHTGRACGGKHRQRTISAFCWHEQETMRERAPSLPSDFQTELWVHLSGSFLGSAHPKLHNLFSKWEILGQELTESL